MVGGSLQPVVLNGRVELGLLVLQVELDAFALNQCLVHLSLGGSVFKERDAHSYAASNAEVGLQLLGKTIVVHGSIAGRDASVGSDGRQLARLRNLDVQVVLSQLILDGLELRTVFESRSIDSVHCRNSHESHLIGGIRNLDVKSFIACNLKQFLQLSLIVLHIAFSLHDVEFILSPLSGELCQVSLTHLSYLHHLLATFFVLLAREIALLVHLDSLCRVENLHVELCNLFLQFDSLGSRIELCSLGRELVQFYLIMVLVSIPDGVVTHHGVVSVVIHLVDAGS